MSYEYTKIIPHLETRAEDNQWVCGESELGIPPFRTPPEVKNRVFILYLRILYFFGEVLYFTFSFLYFLVQTYEKV